jgi:hypothetical protein
VAGTCATFRVDHCSEKEKVKKEKFILKRTGLPLLVWSGSSGQGERSEP